MITNSDFLKISQTTNHTEFYDYLKTILLDRAAREKFFRKVLAIQPDLSVDFFREYFTTNAVTRSKGQHYTPDFLGELMAKIVGEGTQTADITGAGTGALLIQKWHQDRLSVPFVFYRPSLFFYSAVELDSFAVILLIMAFAIRGMNGTIVHGDPLIGRVFNIYFIQNSQDDFMAFSDVNVLPRTEHVARTFGVKEWAGEAITHIESPQDKKQYWETMLEEAQAKLESKA